MMHIKTQVDLLLVDDREDGLLTLEAVLKSLPYRLVMARSGRDALVQLLHGDFAAIIMDVQMPEMDGLETAALIKQSERYKDIPILFVTAINKEPRYVYRGFETGAVDYIFKPFDPHLLRTKVALFVDLFCKNRQLKHQTEALLASEEKNRILIETAVDILCTTQLDGRITALNPAFQKITGFPSSEWIGKPLSSVVHPKDQTLVSAWLSHLNLERNGLREFRLSRLKGGPIWVEDSVTPLQKEGQIKGVLHVLREISERKQAEEERQKRLALERSNEELERFAYLCSHDLQEPLRLIHNYTQLLEMRYGQVLDEPGQEYLKTMREGTSRMSHLIRDLLEFSKLDFETEAPSLVDCSVVLDDALFNLQMAIQECNATIVRGPLPLVRGHHSRLVQLFQNLISNALKFRKGLTPRISISSAPRDKGWLFSVHDDGIGFEKSDVDKVFVVFKRLNRNTDYPGTGVGLAICKKIVEQHHGKIWAESKPGVGSTFRFRLPTEDTVTTSVDQTAFPWDLSNEVS
jgi:PAS domain S-box-containing protein